MKNVFKRNKAWAKSVVAKEPDFFKKLSQSQEPDFLWIGCADSRVPANQVIDLPPGEVFVHRNIANIVNHTDLNFLSVLQFAVDVLEVKHIIVCGHYGCGGVKAALENDDNGIVDNWVRPVKDVYAMNKAEVDQIENEEDRLNRLCELNVLDQVSKVANTTVVQKAWKRGQELTVHGVIYGLVDGLLKDLGSSVPGTDGTSVIYHYD